MGVVGSPRPSVPGTPWGTSGKALPFGNQIPKGWVSEGASLPKPAIRFVIERINRAGRTHHFQIFTLGVQHEDRA